jgi:ribonuclease P protein component
MFGKAFGSGKYSVTQTVSVNILRNYRHREKTRIGVAASSKLGGAVQRNRAKRVVREAMRGLYPRLRDGWFVVISARAPCYSRDTKSGRVRADLIRALEKLNLFVN